MTTYGKIILSLAGALIAWAIVSTITIDRARSHEVDGFKYPQLCCGLGDCAPVEWMGEKDGKMIANTKIHSGVPISHQQQTITMPSPDGRYHICATPDSILSGPRIVYCIFAPAGM